MSREGCKPGEIRMGAYCIPRFCQDFVDHYGYTTELPDAGWLLPDGSVMDMSKMYHTDIARISPDYGKDWRHSFGVMHKFMVGCKAIRYRIDHSRTQDEKILYGQMVSKPTDEQAGRITILMQRDVNHVILEKMDRDSAETKCFVELFNPHPMDYWRFIERCF